MPTIIKNPMQLIGRLLVWRAGLYVGGVLTSATLAALSGMQWVQADAQTKFMVVLGIFGTVAGTIGAFLDDSVKKLARGEVPGADIPNSLGSASPFPPAPGTVEKTVTAQVETKTTLTPP